MPTGRAKARKVCKKQSLSTIASPIVVFPEAEAAEQEYSRSEQYTPGIGHGIGQQSFTMEMLDAELHRYCTRIMIEIREGDFTQFREFLQSDVKSVPAKVFGRK